MAKQVGLSEPHSKKIKTTSGACVRATHLPIARGLMDALESIVKTLLQQLQALAHRLMAWK